MILRCVCVCVEKAHEVLCLEMLTLLLERPTDDSVEVAISFLKECGLKLTEVSPRGINGTFPNLEEKLICLNSSLHTYTIYYI